MRWLVLFVGALLATATSWITGGLTLVSSGDNEPAQTAESRFALDPGSISSPDFGDARNTKLPTIDAYGSVDEIKQLRASRGSVLKGTLFEGFEDKAASGGADFAGALNRVAEEHVGSQPRPLDSIGLERAPHASGDLLEKAADRLQQYAQAAEERGAWKEAARQSQLARRLRSEARGLGLASPYKQHGSSAVASNSPATCPSQAIVQATATTPLSPDSDPLPPTGREIQAVCAPSADGGHSETFTGTLVAIDDRWVKIEHLCTKRGECDRHHSWIPTSRIVRIYEMK